MSVSAVFNTAASSLAAQRVAIDVVSQNIANVNTDGYSRQRVIMETAPTSTQNGFLLGNGVRVALVQRIYDQVLNNQINDATTIKSNNESKAKVLQQVEPYLNEISGNSIGDAIQGLYNSFQSLTLNPFSISERQTVMGRGQILVDSFHQVTEGVKSAQNFADSSLTATTAEISSKAREIASINYQIRSSEMAIGSANELRDRRDLLLEQLSKHVGIDYTEQTDGTVDVKLLGGNSLVSGVKYATMYTEAGSGDVTTNMVLLTQVGSPPYPADPITDVDITSSVGGISNLRGEIGALLYTRDTSLPEYLRKLDELAYNLSYQINNQHESGYNLNGATNQTFFNLTTTEAPPADEDTYAGYSSSIELAITHTNLIAASDTNPLLSGNGIGNNKNALELAALAAAKVTFKGGAEATTSEYYTSLVAFVGVEVQTAKNLATQNESFVIQLVNLRDSNSGVSLDEELTNLLKYQKAFEGASKVINVATEMLDTLMGLIR